MSTLNPLDPLGVFGADWADSERDGLAVGGADGGADDLHAECEERGVACGDQQCPVGRGNYR